MNSKRELKTIPDGPLLDKYLSAVDMRVDIARMEFYRQFSKATSESDFYIESFFNTFIASLEDQNWAFARILLCLKNRMPNFKTINGFQRSDRAWIRSWITFKVNEAGHWVRFSGMHIQCLSW